MSRYQVGITRTQCWIVEAGSKAEAGELAVALSAHADPDFVLAFDIEATDIEVLEIKGEGQ